MFADFIAGWLAGGISLVVGHPLDTVKVRMQTISNTGLIDCIRSTFRNESLVGFYKGMLTPIITVGFMNSALFFGYGATLHLLHPNDSNISKRKDLPMSEILFASIVGSFTQWIPAVPTEVIKTKLQVQRENIVGDHFWQHRKASSNHKHLYRGPFDCARSMLRDSGVRGLYQGGSVQLYRDAIGFLFYIPVYELIYRRCWHWNDTAATVLAGGIAGSLSWASICPLDVIKSRMQAQPTPAIYTSALHCARCTYRDGGWRAFFRGGLVLAVRGFPVNAILFLVYARTMRLLQHQSAS